MTIQNRYFAKWNMTYECYFIYDRTKMINSMSYEKASTEKFANYESAYNAAIKMNANPQ